ncbi:MAG TPA: hypothetical protein VJK06_02605 [Methyloceanibacter sp.]|nr:hypothetical protein [Methyloceanibacter sp.]
MFRSKFIALMTVAAALLGVAGFALAADEAAPAADQPQSQNAETPAQDPSTSGVNDPRRKKPPVAFTDVNYEDAGDAGKLTLAGRGDPGAQILLFFDNDPLGEVVIGEDGKWKFESDRKMDNGQHMFRADRIDGGIVVGRASITVARMDQKK